METKNQILKATRNRAKTKKKTKKKKTLASQGRINTPGGPRGRLRGEKKKNKKPAEKGKQQQVGSRKKILKVGEIIIEGKVKRSGVGRKEPVGFHHRYMDSFRMRRL